MSAAECQAVWAGLLGYGGDPLLAAKWSTSSLPAEAALRQGIEEIDRQLADGPAIFDFSIVDGDFRQVRLAIDTLAALAPERRAEMIVSVLVPATSADEKISGELQEALAVLLATRLVDPDSTQSSNSVLFWSAGAVCAALALVLLGAAVRDTGTASATRTTLPAASATTVSVVPVTTTAPLRLLVADSERVVDIDLESDGTVVRRDPGTAEIVWRSRRYADAVELRVDADVVSVLRSSGWTTYLSLTDGTQLPP